MMVEYGVVIRRQFPHGELRWQLWLGSGMAKEHASFLSVMNHAGGLGFEAVAAGHFDELGVPEVLLQRKMEATTFATGAAGFAPPAEAPKPAPAPRKAAAAESAPKPAGKPAARSSAKKKAPAAKS